MLSIICLFFKKPPRFSEIQVDSRGFRQFAMILVRILYQEFQREMEQKRERLEGLDSLSMRENSNSPSIEI